VEQAYLLAARAFLGERLSRDGAEEMAGVFVSLWGEGAGKPWLRVRLVARELAGLWHLRKRLGRRRGGAGRRKDWNGRDRMGEIWGDFRVGLRLVFKSPVASLAAVLTLGLGIGGTTAVLTVADSVLLNPLDYPDAGELVVVFEETEDGSLGLTSQDNFRDLQNETRTLASMGLFRPNSVAVTGLGEPERIRGDFVTASFFDVLGVPPALGRTLRPGEDTEGGDRAAVLSHAYWSTRFASDPSILGKVVNFNNIPHTIVGVMPPGFRSYWDNTAAWISLHSAPGGIEGRGARGFFVVGRMAEGTDAATADRELDQIMGRLADAYPEVNEGRSTRVMSLRDWVVGDRRRTVVFSLLAAAAMVLLIASANVANLQLARASHRTGEMAIRSALGGGRRRLLAQLLVENLTLAVLGGVLGIGVAYAAVRLLLAAEFSPFAGWFDVAMSGRALGAAAGLTIGTGLLAGIVPALRGSTTAPARQLREEGRSEWEGRAAARFRSTLIVGQMALAVTLLIGAGLLLRTNAALRSVDVGFDSADLLTGETRLTAETYQDDQARRVYLERIVDALDGIPGTRGATLVSGMPFSGDGASSPARAEGSELGWDEAPVVFLPVVATGYFTFMGIDLLSGRTFERTDGSGSDMVVVASRTAADRFYPGLDPVGRMIEAPEGTARIIGVVEDTRRTLTAEIEPTFYLHYLQSPPSLFSILIRTEGAPEPYERTFRDAFWSVDSNQPLWEVTPLETRMSGYRNSERFLSALLGGFAGLALILAAVGMYGVMAHGVGRRRHELGIRLALGAGEGRVLTMVLRQGVLLTAMGAGLGVVAAAGVARTMASVVFGIGVFDPVSFTVAPVVLGIVAVFATYIPARRATRVDPVDAFRG